MTGSAAWRVLIPFAKADLYGLERSVIETFDVLRPDVVPQFVQAASIANERLPVVKELERRGFSYALLPDGDGWPRIRRRKWDGKAVRMALALLEANWFYLRAVRNSDAMCIDGTYTAIFTVAAAARCRLTGKPVILHFHEWPPAPVPRILNAVVSDYFHNTAQGREVSLRIDKRLARKRHWVTPPVIDVQACDSPGEFDSSKKNVVFVGQVSLHKGIDLLIDAFSRIADYHPDAVLHVVGGCQDAFLRAFEAMCRKSGVGDRIKYWGYRPDGRVFLRDAYMSVQSTPPSRCQESFGRTVVEAMAFGTPTVCFGSGALSEIVRDGETGLVCAESADALAAAMDRFLVDRELRDRCGRNAVQRFRDEHSPAVVRAIWLGVLKSVFPMSATRANRATETRQSSVPSPAQRD